MNGGKIVGDETTQAAKALSALAGGIEGKSEIAKLRPLIDHIEAALSAGASRESVLETLRTTLGVRMSMKTFEKNLQRIRKQRRDG
jgi:hypothetical protein